MGLAQSTEKPLKVLKNISKGQKEELNYSLKVHGSDLPLLLSPLILRERGAGQVDLAVLKKSQDWQVILYEIKSSGFITRGQYERLRKTASFVSKIFEASTSIRVIGPKELGIAKDKKLN